MLPVIHSDRKVNCGQSFKSMEPSGQLILEALLWRPSWLCALPPPQSKARLTIGTENFNNSQFMFYTASAYS
jgi:hypothetical protein